MKEYEKLRKKYNLPNWNWIENNFPLKVEEDIPILLQIRKSISEKLYNILNIIEPIIAVTESYKSFIERNMVSKKERENIFEVYKQLQSLLWTSDKISIDYKEKECASWIKEVKNSWEKLKPELISVCEKLSKEWKVYKREETKTAYHG